MYLVDLLVYPVIASVCALAARKLAACASVRGLLGFGAAAFVGACLGGTLARTQTAPGPLGGQSFPVVYAIAGAVLGTVLAAVIGRRLSRGRVADPHPWDLGARAKPGVARRPLWR